MIKRKNKITNHYSKKKSTKQSKTGRNKETIRPVLLFEEPAQGTIEIQKNGHAQFVVDKENSNTSYDLKYNLFVHKNNLNTAMNGDVVMCNVAIDDNEKGNGTQGIVSEIIKRKTTVFSGEINIDDVKGYGFVRTSGRNNMNVDIFIPKENLNGAENNDVVVVVFEKWNSKDKSPTGSVKEVLGKKGVHETEMKSILNDNNICYDFPEEVEVEANAIPIEIPEDEIVKRKDMRDVLTITIDPETAKDFDDAISFQKLKNGNFEVGVHIADVAHYISPGSALDKEAYARATSVYLVDRCIPMLPERLSNGICSLRPNEDKLTFSVIFEISPEGEVISQNFNKTVINSNRRFTYEEAQTIIDMPIGSTRLLGGIEERCDSAITTLNEIAKKLREKRFRKGAMSFNKREPQFVLDENNKAVDVFFHESQEAHQLIEEYMLLANQSVASFVHGQTRPFIYRTHDLPSEERLVELASFVANFGYKLEVSDNIEKTKTSLNNLLVEIQGKGEANIIETLAIRSMAKANYSTQLIGHYGLGFRFYSHFTSPIRRYPDMIAHRLLWEYINNRNAKVSNLDEQCKHCSDRENNAAKAQRESIKYKQCEYLSDKVGQQFVGIISSVTEFGAFIELEENGCDGLLSKKHIESEGLSVNLEKYTIENKIDNINYTLGDKINVIVSRVDIMKRQIDFNIVL